MEMHSLAVDAVLTALDDLDAVWAKLAGLSIQALTGPDALAVLERLEIARRRLPAVEHALITHLQSQCTPKDLGAKSWRSVLANRLGVSGIDARLRLQAAAQLGPRATVTGEPVVPAHAATAAAQARGEIGADHVAVIREFMASLPADIAIDVVEFAEAQLADVAGGMTPEGFREVARQLLGYLDQDGRLDDEREQARKRGVTIGPQRLDGMSRIVGYLDAPLRAALEAILAKLAAPGHCNPDDEHPCGSGTPSKEQISGDLRSAAQRNHDALAAICNQVLNSKKLGRHNGLPVTVVATATLEQLTNAAGRVQTGGGTRILVRTLFARAATVHPFLTLLHNPRKIELYHGRKRRIATLGQRLALFGLDRGCTKPGCSAPPNRCQVHHAIRDWQDGGNTNIDELTLACGCDNRLVNDSPTGWKTRKRQRDNRTEWIPPPHLGRNLLQAGQAQINNYHHPEEILRPDDGGGGDFPDVSG